MLPSFNKITLSQKDAEKLSWVTMKIVAFIFCFAWINVSITARLDLESRFPVGALDYLMKPVREEKLQQLIGRVRAKSAQEESRTFTLKNIDGTWRFFYSDILYFYSDRRKVILVTAKGTYPFYARLDEIAARLSAGFVRIHQRYLINPAHVDYLGSDSVTVLGQELPCSRKYRESALQKIAKSMMGDTFT